MGLVDVICTGELLNTEQQHQTVVDVGDSSHSWEQHQQAPTWPGQYQAVRTNHSEHQHAGGRMAAAGAR